MASFEGLFEAQNELAFVNLHPDEKFLVLRSRCKYDHSKTY